MLQVISDYTGKREPCTIQTGVIGHDGVRRFAIADIDLFAMFNWEDEAGREVDVISVYIEEQSRPRGRVKLAPPTEDEYEYLREQVERGENVGRRTCFHD